LRRLIQSPRSQLPFRLGSALRRKNDAEQDPFVRPYLPGSANMRTTIRRDHIVDLVIGNRRPFAVDLDLVMVADHAALRRAAVHEITAGASAVVSVQLRVKLRMPPIVADPVISFLRHRAYTQEYGHDASYRYPSPNIRDHKSSPQWDKKTPSPVPPGNHGTMICRWGCHREPHGAVCNRIPLLSKCAPPVWLRGLA
jgi:hypothetical protein